LSEVVEPDQQVVQIKGPLELIQVLGQVKLLKLHQMVVVQEVVMEVMDHFHQYQDQLMP